MNYTDLEQLLNSENANYSALKNNIFSSLRVAMPGIVTSFDSENQTATIQPAIRQKIRGSDGNNQFIQLPLLPDVQVILPRCNDFVLTMPLKPGDEGLIIFLDSCYNLFWSYGGIQNPQELRKHDLSDAVFIPSIFSNPKNIKNYSNNSTQLRNIEGTSYIEFKGDSINIVGNVTLNGKTIKTE